MLKESSLYKIKEDHRSSLYYAQYEWCITINISEAPCLRYLDSKKFERAIVNAKHWSEQDRFGENFRAWGPTKETALRETSEEIGLVVSKDQVIGQLDPVTTLNSGFSVMMIFGEVS